MENPFILVTADGKEELELVCEPDGRYLMSSLAALVGGTPVGLTYTSPQSSRQRGVRVVNGEILPPSDGWLTSSNRIYRVVFYNTAVEPVQGYSDVGKVMLSEKMEKREERVWIFLDNSNFWIGAKQQIGEKRGLISEDHRVRTEFGKLLKFTANGRPIANAILYGSEPPPSDSVWELAENEGWKVDLSHKSYSGREKQVDPKMVNDIAVTACKKSPEIMILITGDEDFIPPMNTANEHKWKIEVYGWNKSMSHKIRELHDGSNVKVTCVDTDFSQFMITELQFDMNIAKENGSINLNGIVLEISQPDRMKICENIEKFCERLVTILHWPIQYNWLSRSNLAIQLRSNEKYESCVSDEVLKTISDERFDFVTKVMTYNQYLHSDNPSTPALTISVPYDNGNNVDLDEYQQEKEEPYTTVKRKQKPKHQKYSDPCTYKFNCPYGGKCANKHTNKEKEFFKKYGGKSKPYRKTTLCTYFPKCKYSKEDCLNAHGEEDAWCNNCLANGHFTDEKKCTKVK